MAERIKTSFIICIYVYIYIYINTYLYIWYLIGLTGITYIFSRNYAKIKVDSYESEFLPLEKRWTFYDVIIHVKSVWKKD